MEESNQIITARKRKEEILKVKELAKCFMKDPKNANCIIDVIARLESNDTSVVTASIHAVANVFTQLLKRGSMWLERPSLGEQEDRLDRTAEEKLKLWLLGRYEDVIGRLLEFFAGDKQKIQELSLCTVMKFIAAQGCNPLSKVAKEKHYFPADLLEKVIKALLSEEHDLKDLIEKFEEYADFPDVKFHTLKIMKSLIKSRKSEELSEKYLFNCFNLMKLLTFPCDTNGKEMDANAEQHINLCTIDDSEAVHFKFEPSSAKKIYSSMWLRFLKIKLPGALYRRVLLCLDEKILPCMEYPLLLTDFLMDSYNIGGVISILALNGLFFLMVKHNLEFPDFYKNLYSLFEPNIFFTKYRARFFFLSDIFLTSTHLPEYLVGAFAKRLSRISLCAPPHCLVLIIPFIRNLLLRHPGLYKLINNPKAIQDVASDPYIMDEPDPAKCNAMNSSLWEIKTLQSHYHPRVVQAAKFIDQPLPKMETDISEYLELTVSEMIEDETKRKSKNVPLTYQQPLGLFNHKEDTMCNVWKL